MSIKRKFKKDFTSSFNINDEKANVKQKLDFKEPACQVKPKRSMVAILSFVASLLVIISASTILVFKATNKKEANDSNANLEVSMHETATVSQEVVAENSSLSLAESIAEETEETDNNYFSDEAQLDGSTAGNIPTEENTGIITEEPSAQSVIGINCIIVNEDELYYYVTFENEIVNPIFMDENDNILEYELSDSDFNLYKIKKGDYTKIIASSN